MYTPHAFKEDRLPVLHDAIERSGLATLVTVTSTGLVASHIPMLVDATRGPYGTLSGHLARANSQWREGTADAEALAIFIGPETYVSPSWYATTQRTGKVVPTWNYVAVHAYGRVVFFDDPDRLRTIVTRLTNRHEAALPKPWHVTDAPEDFIEGQLKAIVGFEMVIARLEGKWKLSQNRPDDDRRGVIQGLGELNRESAADVAAVMADREDGDRRP